MGSCIWPILFGKCYLPEKHLSGTLLDTYDQLLNAVFSAKKVEIR